MPSIDAKVVVLGSQGVGKTSIVVRYVGKYFNPNVSPTIGASFFTFRVTLESFRVKLEVWDTAGQERFRSMAPMYYRKANAALLVYDITCARSFDDIKVWVKELQTNLENNIALCLVGNKADLKDGRQVSQEEGLNYANYIGADFFETSAVSGEGIQETFIQLAKGLIYVYESTTPRQDYDHGGGQDHLNRRSINGLNGLSRPQSGSPSPIFLASNGDSRSMNIEEEKRETENSSCCS